MQVVLCDGRVVLFHRTLLQVLKFVVAHGDVFLSVLRERNTKPTLESLEELSLATAVICRAAVNGNHHTDTQQINKLECGPMPNLMVALPNIGGALCSTPQSLADAHY